jgi:hypothetical protein
LSRFFAKDYGARLGRRELRPPLQPRFHILAQLPHQLGGLADIRFAKSDVHVRGDRQKPGVQVAVARIAFPRQLHELRAPVLWIVDEFDESFGCELIRQPLHPLSAGRPHLSDLRHSQRTKQGEASHEAERTAAPSGDQTCPLVAMTITACAQFLLARHVVGDRVRQRFGHAVVRVSQLLERRGVMAVAGTRLLPGPFSELNMLAGLTVLKLRDFTIGTIIGCVPKALAWSGLGALLF